jgi:hypothetical protein
MIEALYYRKLKNAVQCQLCPHFCTLKETEIGKCNVRQNIKGKLDLFISLFGQDIPELLDTVKEFNPTLHFLTIEESGKFGAARGNLEVEENLRSVCVQKYYPKSFWGYLSCRAKNIESSWWEDCLKDMEVTKIKSCARSDEGRILLEENIQLNKELKIMFGPTYLIDNQEIFSSQGVPSREELKKIIKK